MKSIFTKHKKHCKYKDTIIIVNNTNNRKKAM